jgi:hypothetical protein
MVSLPCSQLRGVPLRWTTAVPGIGDLGYEQHASCFCWPHETSDLLARCVVTDGASEESLDSDAARLAT